MKRRDLMIGTAAGTGLLLLPLLRALAEGSERRIPVVARRFVFIPNRIEVKRGETVVLEFTAPEVAMGFYAPALKLRTVIVPGETARLRFTADITGSFDFLCDVFCGDGHEGMNGQLVVT